MSKRRRGPLRNWIEFIPAWLLLRSLGLLPRTLAILIGKAFTGIAYYLHSRLRRVAYRNLQLVMPEMDARDRKRVVKGLFSSLGRMLGEFSQFPRITTANVSDYVVYEGFENYASAEKKGQGVLFLTGHFGAWELCAFAHGAHGHPLNFLVRPLDNHMLDNMITKHRCLSGNHAIDKNNAVRPVLAALKRKEAVGFLIDVNTMADQGVFCDFFGLKACSTPGLAVFALRTGAPVVPGFLIWDKNLKKHVLYFGPEVPLIKTGDFDQDVLLNTTEYSKVIESMARRHPDQWLWVHKRWQTRPPGEPPLY